MQPHTALLSGGVNEANMLEDHSSYHQALTGEEAERRLKQCGGHCYLTRYSKKHKCYVLSVYEDEIPPSEPTIEHFEIVIQNFSKLHIRNKTQTFNSIHLLLQHYEHKRIDPALRSIGEERIQEITARSIEKQTKG